MRLAEATTTCSPARGCCIWRSVLRLLAVRRRLHSRLVAPLISEMLRSRFLSALSAPYLVVERVQAQHIEWDS
eukprot:749703-Pleurochrysis_carterae.AAC.3